MSRMLYRHNKKSRTIPAHTYKKMQNVGKKKSSVHIQLSGWLRTLDMVEVTGLEPAASASRTQRSTKLSHTSLFNFYIFIFLTDENLFALLRSLLLRCPKFFTPWSGVKFRPRRLFVLASSSAGCARTQSYQTEPHLVITTAKLKSTAL